MFFHGPQEAYNLYQEVIDCDDEQLFQNVYSLAETLRIKFLENSIKGQLEELEQLKKEFSSSIIQDQLGKKL